MPTLATGYGPLSIADFGNAIGPLGHETKFAELMVTIVVRSDESATTLRRAIAETTIQ